MILVVRRICCKAEKENGVTARRSTLPLSESLSDKSPHFLFSDLELEALVVYESRAEDNSKAALGVEYG